MESFGFLLGRRIFEECLQTGCVATLKVRHLRQSPRQLHALLDFYAAIGGWAKSPDAVADFWLGFQSGQVAAAPRLKPKKIQLALFS